MASGEGDAHLRPHTTFARSHLGVWIGVRIDRGNLYQLSDCKAPHTLVNGQTLAWSRLTEPVHFATTAAFKKLQAASWLAILELHRELHVLNSLRNFGSRQPAQGSALLASPRASLLTLEAQKRRFNRRLNTGKLQTG